MKGRIANRESPIRSSAAPLRRRRGRNGSPTATSPGAAGSHHSPFAIRRSRLSGFSLIELLVALAVFAAMAALAYGGLDAVTRARAELAAQQAQFQSLLRGVALLERDLRQAVVRPVRGNYGEPLLAFAGLPDRIELTRAGFANPQAEQRSNLERVAYAFERDTLQRYDYPVLDRAATTAPQRATLRSGVVAFRLRYLDLANHWSDTWPPPQVDDPAPLPRAVEFRIETKDAGEISRIVELASSWPPQSVEAAGPPLGGAP